MISLGSRSIAVCLFATSCLLAGCGKQGEGERCDTNNGNLDCESGLQCKNDTELGAGSEGDLQGAALCCPPSQADATTSVCRGTSTVPPEPTDVPPDETPDAAPAPTTTQAPDSGSAPPADGG